MHLSSMKYKIWLLKVKECLPYRIVGLVCCLVVAHIAQVIATKQSFKVF